MSSPKVRTPRSCTIVRAQYFCRDIYTDDDLLGKRKGAFAVQQPDGVIRKCYRLDLELVNKRGRVLQCSHFKPNVVPSADGKLPCVVFCHCNSGSRRDAEEAVKELVPRNITVFCMDFEGSGRSEGNWVTLGANEVEDLTTVVDYLRADESTSYIGLWGRSMGAVTALLYSRRDPSIAGMVRLTDTRCTSHTCNQVLDSPFSRLTDLMMELVEEQKIRIPKAMLKVAINMLRRSVRKRAGFSIDDVAPVDHVHESYIPALFGALWCSTRQWSPLTSTAHGQHDTFIKLHHSQRLHDAYAGQKELRVFEGDHNDPRPSWFMDSAYIFFHFQFQMDDMPLLPQFKEYGARYVTWVHSGHRHMHTASGCRLVSLP